MIAYNSAENQVLAQPFTAAQNAEKNFLAMQQDRTQNALMQQKMANDATDRAAELQKIEDQRQLAQAQWAVNQPKDVIAKAFPDAPIAFEKANGPGTWALASDAQIQAPARAAIAYHSMRLGLAPPAPSYTKLNPNESLYRTDQIGQPDARPVVTAPPAPIPDKAPTYSGHVVGKDGFIYTQANDGTLKNTGVKGNLPAASIYGNGEIDPAGMDLIWQTYKTTGAIPTGAIPRSDIGKKQFWKEIGDRAKADGMNGVAIAANKQEFAATSQALNALTKQENMVGAFEKTAQKNMDLVLQLSDKVDRSGSPLINRGIIHWRQGVTGDPDTQAFVGALTAARTEYAKVLSGATGATGITDAARKEADDLFSKVNSKEQLVAAISTARQEMANRMAAFKEQRAQLRGTNQDKTTEHPADISAILGKYK